MTLYTGALIDTDAVRDYLALNQTPSTSQYTDGTIGSNILAAQSQLEQVCGRFFSEHVFTVDSPFLGTTVNRQQVPLPGFREIVTVTKGGSTLNANGGYWLTPDAQQTGVFVGIAFRAAGNPGFWPGVPGTPYGPWITNPQWFDQAADSPFYPANVGGGYWYTSLPNDLAIVGTAGYDLTIPYGYPGAVPFDVLDAIKIFAAYKTMRPASVLADVAVTPQGGVITYSSMPREVQAFIANWKIGQQIVSVGG